MWAPAGTATAGTFRTFDACSVTTPPVACVCARSPAGLTMAASWDVDAMLEWGNSMGKEFYAKGANVQLGPGMCAEAWF